jgi:ankyrin repeat protein
MASYTAGELRHDTELRRSAELRRGAELRRDTELFHLVVKNLLYTRLHPYLIACMETTGRWDVDITHPESRQTGLMLCVLKAGAPAASDYARHLDTASTLLLLGANVHAQDWRGDTALHHAIRSAPRRLDIINRLLEAGALVTAQNLAGQTPLHCAMYEHALVDLLMGAAIINKIINKKDFHLKDARGCTPLHAAAYNGSMFMTTSLIANGADPCDTNSYGHTSLHVMCMSTVGNTFPNAPSCDMVATLGVLLRAGAPVSTKDDGGHDAVYYAATRGRHALVVQLLDNGASAVPLPPGKLPKLLATAVLMDRVHHLRTSCEAFMMGLKPRLGQRSVVFQIDEEIARMIISFVYV